jgi:hypothetical protein
MASFKPANVWAQILSAVKPHVNGQTFSTWLKPTRQVGELNGNRTLAVQVPTEEFRGFIEENFSAAIGTAIEKLGLAIVRVQYLCPEPEPVPTAPAIEIVDDEEDRAASEPEAKADQASPDSGEGSKGQGEKVRPLPEVIVRMPAVPDICWRGELKAYLELLAPFSHSADAMHMACFLTVFGALLSKSVYIQLPHVTYPNLFTMLVAPSGVGGKTQAMKWIVELLLNLMTEANRRETRNLFMVENIGSGEGIIEEAKVGLEKVETRELASMLLLIDEFNSVLRRGAWTGSTLIPTLKQAFDPRPVWQSGTKNNRTELRNPPMLATLLGIETQDLAEMEDRDVRGGLGNRVLYVTGNLKRTGWESMFMGPEQRRWKQLRDTLMRKVRHWHKEKSTEFSLTDAALNGLWKKFWISKEDRGADKERIRLLSIRDSTHVAKVAMLYAALEAGSPRVTEEHLEAAIAWIDYCLLCRYQIFADAGLRPWVKRERDIVEYIRRQSKPVTHRHARRRFDEIGTEEWERLLKSLVADEQHEDRPLAWRFLQGKRGRTIRCLALNA